MKNITINTKNSTIVITKAFEKKAMQYGTAEYKALIDAKNQFEGFTVVVKASTRKTTARGINLEFIEAYVVSHDNADKMIEEFNILRNGNVPFATIKSWFNENYPEVEQQIKDRCNTILVDLNKKKERAAKEKEAKAEVERKERVEALAAQFRKHAA